VRVCRWPQGRRPLLLSHEAGLAIPTGSIPPDKRWDWETRTAAIAEPLGADFMIGLGPEHDRRCAEMVGPDDMVGPSNSREWREAADGSATGLGTADSLARVYAALACGGELDGVQVLRAETIEAAVQEQPLLHGDGASGEFGLGYQLLWKQYPGLPAPTFGHTGMGGSIGLADPTNRLGFGYVMNQIAGGTASPPGRNARSGGLGEGGSRGARCR